MFVTEQSSRYKVDEGNVITIGLDTQTVFYQPTSFYTGQNIQIIRHAKLDRYNAMFLIVAIKKLVEKFSWGSYGATLTRLRKSRVYLPATDKGEIDFDFMSAFMKDVEYNILNTTLNVFKDRISVNKSKSGGGFGRTSSCVNYSLLSLQENRKDLTILKNQIEVLVILVQPIRIMVYYVL